MVIIEGKYNTAVCYTPELEETAARQIVLLCDQEAFKDCKIRIMPDVHAGLGCTIGTTMTVNDKVVPAMVGVDIGCGMETIRIDAASVDFDRLDELIHRRIPSGRDVRKTPHELSKEIDLESLKCARHVKLDRAQKSIGTLGGGNHFIELGRGESGLYLVVHSGSRHLGTEVAKYYQDRGWLALLSAGDGEAQETIASLKAEGRQKEIQRTLKRLERESRVDIPKDLAYVEGELFSDYIHDMKLVQRFAVLNRKAMADIIMKGMGWSALEDFTTIHNYIDTESMILRKGAVSAKAGEKLLIPINMRDGSLICIGKGNEDWNYSAPHGAGRIMSRRAAFGSLSMAEYEREMNGIYTSSVSKRTLDEAPMAYKPIEEIMEQITPCATIVDRVMPLYNFKAAE